METTLALRPVARAGSGPDLRNWKNVVQYEVEGLPSRQEAWSAEIDHRMADSCQGRGSRRVDRRLQERRRCPGRAGGESQK